MDVIIGGNKLILLEVLSPGLELSRDIFGFVSFLNLIMCVFVECVECNSTMTLFVTIQAVAISILPKNKSF